MNAKTMAKVMRWAAKKQAQAGVVAPEGERTPPQPEAAPAPAVEPRPVLREELILGNNIDVLRQFPDNTFTAVVTDPPYGLSGQPDMREVLGHWLAGDDYEHTGSGFMGKEWDSFVPGPSVWKEIMRVLKPGGHILSFSGCYDRTTEVLTKKGWRHFTEISLEDEFATLNPETMEIEYQKPKEIVCQSGHKTMRRFRTNKVDLLITPNHNVFFKNMGGSPYSHWRLGRADKLPGAVNMKKNGVWNGKEEKFFVLPGHSKNTGHGHFQRIGEINIPMDVWLMFFGLWLAEGSSTKTRVSTGWGYNVSICHFNNDNLDKLETALSPYFRICRYRDSGKFRINHQGLCEYLMQFGHAWEKYIPDWVKELSSRQLRVLWDWYMRGDGSANGSSARVFGYTTSKRLVDDWQEVALKMGISADYGVCKSKIGMIKDRVIETRHQCYVITFNETQNEPEIYRRKGKPKSNKIVLNEEVSFDDDVFCVEVPKYHTLYVRRGGKTVWCGNTRTYDLMVTAMRLAGCEIRDKIDYYCGFEDYMAWVHGQGFPKSLNISSNIGKTIDKIDFSGILEAWKKNSKTVQCVEYPFPRSQTGDGTSILKSGSVLVGVVRDSTLENKPWSAIFAELQSQGLLLTLQDTEGNTSFVHKDVEGDISGLKSLATCAAKRFASQGRLPSMLIFTARCDVRELLNAKTNRKDREGEALKTWLGKWILSERQDSDVLYVELIENLKHTMLSQSKTFQNLDTKSQMDFASAISVIITESTAENLISFTEDILRSDVEKFRGLGTALKPAHEPIAVFGKGSEPLNPDAAFKYQAKAASRERSAGCENLFWLTDADGKTCAIPKEDYDRMAAENEARKGDKEFAGHRLSKGNCHPCLHPDSVVLTDSGMVMVKDVEVGDEVYSHDGRYHRVTDKFSKPCPVLYDIRVKGCNIGTLVSDNHPFLVCRPTRSKKGGIKSKEIGWVKAEDMMVGDYTMTPISKMGIEDGDTRENFWFVAGLWLAEGSFLKSGHGDNKYPVWTLNASETEFVERIRKVTDKRVSVYPKEGGGVSVVVFDPSLGEKYDVMCGCYSFGKRLSRDVFMASSASRRSFLNGYLAGDGNNIKNERRAKTVSERLAYQLKILGESVGYYVSCSCYKSPHGKGIGDRKFKKVLPVWHLSFTIANIQASGKRVVRPMVVEFEGVVYTLQYVKKVEKLEYDGEVVNLTVEGTHTFQTAVGMSHNTVKPLDLIRYLVKMVKMPGDNLILDPFVGSGTTAVACVLEGCGYVGIDMDEMSIKIATHRVAYAKANGEAGYK